MQPGSPLAQALADRRHPFATPGLGLDFGLRRSRRAFLRAARITEHQEQIAAAVEHCSGGRTDDREWLAGVAHHLLHLGHRIAAGKALTQPGADQQITLLDVGGVRDMAQLQVVRVAGTYGDRAQPVAIDLHRDAMGDVGDQQHARCIGHDLDHLPHQPAGVEHRLTDKDTVLFALVDEQPMREGVRIEPDQLRHQHAVIDQRRRVEQFAQAHILFGQHGQLLQAALHQQCLGLESFVLGHQFAGAGQLLGRGVPGAHRQVGEPVERRQGEPELAAYRLERIEARIHHHQRDANHGQHQQAHTERRSFGEERLNIDTSRMPG